MPHLPPSGMFQRGLRWESSLVPSCDARRFVSVGDRVGGLGVPAEGEQTGVNTCFSFRGRKNNKNCSAR